MLKLFNKEHVAIGALTKLKDYKIEYLLSGEDSIEFSLSISDENIHLVEEEGYIQNKLNEYVIKAIDPSQEIKRFSCSINIESIVGKSIQNFDTSNNNINDTIRLAIAGTGWILADNNITKRRTVRLKNTNALEVLREVRKVFRVDFRFDAINKIIHVYEQFGSDKGVYFTDELNLRSLDIPSDTYDYSTRLYAYGKDGLTIASVNDGKEYVDNFQYSNKIIEYIWEDNRYTDINSLKSDAEAKLAELSKPKRSYKASVADLAKYSEEYNFLDFFLGDTITLLSRTEKFRDKQRIVKYIQYPNNPGSNTCELDNTILTFEDIQKENESKNEIIDNITSDNGTVDGSKVDGIKTEQIYDFEASVAKITDLTVINADIANLKAQNVNITGKLTAIEAEFGTLKSNVAIIDSLTVTHTAQINNLEANKASITQLNAVSATIGTLEVEVGKIQTLVNGNLSSENIQAGGITSDKLTISNGFIKNAMIESLDVSKINAGDISTNKFRITSDSGNILISDNTIQIKDTNRVRVQIGKDASNDYNMYVWDANGNLMFDATGLKAGGIKDKIIRNDMISDNANIDGGKLNINSVVTSINNGSTTIKSSKVQLDGTNQTLDISFNSLKTEVQGIQIGGRNLAEKTNQGTLGWTWSMQNGNYTKEDYLENNINCCKFLRGTTPWSGWNVILYQFIGTQKYIADTLYTVSFKVKSSIVTTFTSCRLLKSDGTTELAYMYKIKNNTTKVNEWVTIEFNIKTTKTLPVDLTQQLYLSGMSSDVGVSYIFKDLKIERGDRATDYTQAPEDVDNQINSIKEITTSHSTTISVMQGQINTAINNTQIIKDGQTILLKDDYNRTVQTVNSMNSTLSSHTTKINEANGKIENVETKVNTVERDLNSITARVSSTETNVTTVNNVANNALSKANQGVSDAAKAQSTANTANSQANTNKGNITNLQSEVTTVKSNVASLDVNLQGITQRVSSNESTTVSLTNQVNQVDGKINNAKNDAITSSVGVKDTRNTNESPGWYFTNYPKRAVDEFKTFKILGINTSSAYGVLTTNVPWLDSSGGYPVQTFRSNSGGTYERKGTSNTTWGSWQQIEDTNGSQSKANKALTDAKAYATTEITKTNNKVASIETNLNSITSRVSSVESTTTSINGQVSSLTSRMSLAEQKITSDAIVSTVKNHQTNGQSTFVTGSIFEQTVSDFQFKFQQLGSENLVKNSWFKADQDHWEVIHYNHGDTSPESSDVGVVLGNANDGWTPLNQKVGRIINYGVDGQTNEHWHGFSQYIEVESSTPYTLSFYAAKHRIRNCVIEIKREDNGIHIGGQKYIPGSEISESREQGSSFQNDFTLITHTFYVPSNCTKIRVLIWSEGKINGQASYLWFSQTQLEKGHEATARRENSAEIYSNITRIDGRGMTITHRSGSRSEFTHEAIDFFSPNGRRTLRIKDGGLNFHTFNDPAEMVGFIKSAYMTNTTWNGVALSTYADGDFLMLGVSTDSNENGWSTNPNILITAHGNMPNRDQAGTWFLNKPVFLQTRTHLRGLLDVDPGTHISLYANSSTPHQIFNNTSNHLIIVGDNRLGLGIRNGEASRTGIVIIEDGGAVNKCTIDSYANWNFQNYTMYNMNIARSLQAQSFALRARVKDINESYSMTSMTDGDIRFTCRQPEHITNKTLIVELPQIFSENIELDYHINISKLSWGDYRITEKTPYYFEIETNVDNFSFTYEIVAKSIEKPIAYTSIATSQFLDSKAGEGSKDTPINILSTDLESE